ncbi:transposase [Streptomyces sp. AC558_RSS880]|uniref:transposase n=1 Tax=Streptomyces sp. AC558_RSS880 TaxID=2823687 RepID=UPI0035AECF6F
MSLTDAQWARTEPLLPDRSPRRDGRWWDHRQVLDAIAFKYHTCSPPCWPRVCRQMIFDRGSWSGDTSP